MLTQRPFAGLPNCKPLSPEQVRNIGAERAERIQALFARLGTLPGEPTDALTIAVEAAVVASEGARHRLRPHLIDTVFRDIFALLPDATDMERGLALGLALALASEPQDGR